MYAGGKESLRDDAIWYGVGFFFVVVFSPLQIHFCLPSSEERQSLSCSMFVINDQRMFLTLPDFFCEVDQTCRATLPWLVSAGYFELELGRGSGEENLSGRQVTPKLSL